MVRRIGLSPSKDTHTLAADLLAIMRDNAMDYHKTFRDLTDQGSSPDVGDA